MSALWGADVCTCMYILPSVHMCIHGSEKQLFEALKAVSAKNSNPEKEQGERRLGGIL